MSKQLTDQTQALYSHQLITITDLEKFKQELLFAIKELLKPAEAQPASKWLRSKEVRRMLNISPGTLQNLRVNGVLPYTKVGGAMYYNADDIEKILTKGM
jgi:hypothetical protein